MSRNAGRSTVTVLGTALGSAAFVATLGLGSTLQRQVSDSFDVRRATEVVVRPEDKSIDHQWQSDASLERVRRLNGVTSVGRRLSLPEQTVTRALAVEGSAMNVIGADPGALAVIQPRILQGRSYDAFHERTRSRVVLVPQALAQSLAVDRPGVAIFIHDRAYTVAGIFDEVQRRPESLLAILMPASAAQELENSRQPGERDVLVATAPGAAQLIGGQAALALRPEGPGVLRSIAPADPRTMRREIESSITTSSLLLSLISLVAGALSIANAAMASIAVRTPEIGLRRAIGARRIHIFAQLIGETTALGSLGGLVGVGAGVVAICVVSLINTWSPVLDLRATALAVALSAATGLLAGLWPAAKAMRIQPVAALQR
ncbi:ABC transporter permease [Micromonospora noduli]|uniref:ABC transporter permease n=1 Tax=Micromonospora noduli TaxID=709876 RepID=UPI00142DE72F|nr:ABC transporter permease [Micromonospora noduli]